MTRFDADRVSGNLTEFYDPFEGDEYFARLHHALIEIARLPARVQIDEEQARSLASDLRKSKHKLLSLRPDADRRVVGLGFTAATILVARAAAPVDHRPLFDVRDEGARQQIFLLANMVEFFGIVKDVRKLERDLGPEACYYRTRRAKA